MNPKIFTSFLTVSILLSTPCVVLGVRDSTPVINDYLLLDQMSPLDNILAQI